MKKFLTIMMVLIICFIWMNFSVFVSSKVKKIKTGSKLYKENRFDESAKAFEEAVKIDPNSDVANYDLGTALFKTGDYETAVDHLEKALLTDKKELKQKSHYNLANTLFKNGLSKEKAELQAAVDLVGKSVDNYTKAVELNVKDDDAKYNQDLALKELERLKKELEKQKSSQGNKSDKNQQSKDQQSKDQQSKDQSQDSQQQSSQEKNSQEKNKDQSSENKENQEQSQQDSQKTGQKDKEEENQKQEDGTNEAKEEATQGNSKDLSKEEAKMLLEEYENNEEPKGLLNFVPVTGREKSVEKDW